MLRLLESGDLRLDLAQLDFYEDDRAVLKTVMRRQYGMLLMVGPTGSGKTTTLYALLNQLDAQRKNVITIEDPVEYHLPRLTQVSVQPAQGLGFAEALRATLRQDPDVILVGEIRDEEMAQIAFKPALTGHLVLVTLHTNNTLSCLQRLENLGVERALIADTLLLVLSQRLVRSAVGGRCQSMNCSVWMRPSRIACDVSLPLMSYWLPIQDCTSARLPRLLNGCYMTAWSERRSWN